MKKIFRVNEFITLKLENDKTNIYIADEIYDFFSPDDLMYASDSDSITPEEEFQGHCSNLRAWAENDYNTEILHRTIAFPLLKQLVIKGDEKAKKNFKEEIAYIYIKLIAK